MLLDPCRTWCPASTCQAVCQLQEVALQTPQLVQCKACDTEFCSACKASWHPGQGCPETAPVTFLPGDTRYALRTAGTGRGLGEASGGGGSPPGSHGGAVLPLDQSPPLEPHPHPGLSVCLLFVLGNGLRAMRRRWAAPCLSRGRAHGELGLGSVLSPVRPEGAVLLTVVRTGAEQEPWSPGAGCDTPAGSQLPEAPVATPP